MRRILNSVLLLLAIPIVGCHKDQATTPSESGPYAGRSIADMQAEFDRLQGEHEKKCRFASPTAIAANQAVCEQERQRLAPLGNALMQAKIKAAQRATNP